MKNLYSNITNRQLFLYFALICPAIKMFILPASFTYYAGNDGYLGVIFQCVVDLLVFLSIYYFIKNANANFFDTLSSILSKPVAKFIYFFYAIFFAIKCFIPLFESILLCHEVLYESSHSFMYFIPIFLVLFYASLTGFNGLFRVVEIVYPFVLIASFGLAFLSFPSANFENLLPVMQFGANPILLSVGRHLGWFGDFAVLLLLTDNVDLKEKGANKIILGYALGCFSIILFFVYAIAIFGATTNTQLFMLSKISKYSVVFSDLGRSDFIFIAILFLATMLYCLIACSFSVKCLHVIFKLDAKLLALIVVGTLLIGSMLFVHKPFSILSFIEDYSLYIFLPLQYILPLLLPIFLAIGKDKRKGKLGNAIGKDNKEIKTQREIKTLSLEGKKEACK